MSRANHKHIERLIAIDQTLVKTCWVLKTGTVGMLDADHRP
jgi:hypothetical protein